MSGSDIALKLLPFTHSENNQVSLALTSMDMGELIITAVILVLFSAFLISSIKLWKSKNEDEKDIDYLYDALNKFDPQTQMRELEEYLKVRGENGKPYKIWSEFKKSLVKTRNKHNRQQYDYYNSIDAEYFFNKKTLLTHLGSKMYATIPSLLLGIGLIGTFLGLFVGLVQLDLSDEKTLSTSMQALIHAAGVKFASSIWGLGLSLIFTYREKSWEKGLEDKIDEIQRLIDYKFDRRTAEQSLEDINQSSKEQLEQMNNLAASVSEQLTRELTTALTPTFEKIHSDFGSLGGEISNAITTTLQEPLSQIANTVSGAVQNQAAQSTEMLESIIAKFIEQIDQKAGSHAETIRQNIIATETMMSQVVQNLQMFSEESTKNNANLTLTVSQTIEKSEEREKTLFVAIEKMIASIETTTTDMSSKLGGTISNLSEQLEVMLANMSTQIGTINETIIISASKLSDVPSQIDRFQKTLEQFIQLNNSIAIASQKLDNSSMALSDFSNNIGSTSNDIAVYSKEVNRLVETMRNVSIESEKTYKDLALQFSNLTDKNAESARRYEESVRKYLNEYHEQIQNAVRNTFGEFDSKLKDFAQSMTEAVVNLTDAVEELNTKNTK